MRAVLPAKKRIGARDTHTHTHTHTRVYTSDTYAGQLHIGASMLGTSGWRWEGQPEEALEGEAAFGMPRRKAAEDEEEEEKKSTARGGGA